MPRREATASMWPKIMALGALGTILSVAYSRWRRRAMPRRDPLRPYHDFRVTTSDRVSLGVRLIPGGKRGAMIVAHPAVTGQRYSPLVDLAESMAAYFDVYTFDFRGHGMSQGHMELNLRGPIEDFHAVVSEVRSRGYPWVGAVGFSLGGMSAFLHASLHGMLDAVAMVGSPPRLPDNKPPRRLPIWSLWLRTFGARYKAVNYGGPAPLDAADDFPDIPLLIVHGAEEPFYPREELDSMLQKLGGKAELWVIEGGGHTELKGREQEVVEWMVRAASGRSESHRG